MLHSFLHGGFPLHSGQRVGAACKTFTNTPFGSELLVCIPRSPAAMGSLNVASKDKNFVCAEGGNTV